MDIQYLIKRWDKLKADRALYDSLWQDLGEFVLPRKSNIVTKRSKGQKQTERLYDSTAIHANELLASSLNSAVTSAVTRWFSLKLRNKEDNDQPDIASWLDDCADRIFLSFLQSNFNSEIHECYLDLGSFGTACLMVDETIDKQGRFTGFLFKSLPPEEYCLAENADGRVDTLFREFPLTVRNVLARWGRDSGERILSLADNETKKDDAVTIVHAVFPRTKKRLFQDTSWWESYYFIPEHKHILSEKAFREFPYCVPRWAKTSGETYGRGPGHTALPDIRSLNKACELSLKWWAKQVDPPMMAQSDGVVGTVKLQPGGLTMVTNMDAIKPLDLGGKFEVHQFKAEELRMSIRHIFFTDQLTLPSMESRGNMTATEVSIRYEIMQRLLGPTLGRIESELLNPLIEKCFAKMFRAGALAEVPPSLARGSEIDIEYEGPLAKAQKMEAVHATEAYIADMQVLGQLDQSVWDNVNLDVMSRQLATRRGVPIEMLRDDRTRNQIRAQRAKAMAEMAKLQQAQMATQSAKDLSEAKKNVEESEQPA